MTTIDSSWDRSENWRKRRQAFAVEVKHWQTIETSFFGRHRWAIYAYLYKTHPRFGRFEGDSLWQPATDDLPLHGGCTYLHYHGSKRAEVDCVEVGADYMHLGDEHFTEFSTSEEAGQVFREAQALFDLLAAEAGQTLVAEPAAAEGSP